MATNKEENTGLEFSASAPAFSINDEGGPKERFLQTPPNEAAKSSQGGATVLSTADSDNKIVTDDDHFINSDAESSNKAQEYKTTPWRWLILLVIAMATICQTMTVMTLAPVVSTIQDAYQLKSSMPVSLCAMSFSLCSIPMTFVAVWAYANYSTSAVLRTTVTVQFIGAMFRLLAIPTGQFWPILAGTVLQACGAPFIINSQIVICNKWFADKERALATSLLTVSLPMGTAFAFVFTAYYFKDVTGDNKDNLARLLVMQSYMFVGMYAAFMLIFHEKPEHPPSAVAEAPIQNLKFSEAFAVMKQNKSYMLHMISFSLMFGFYVSYGNLISLLFTPFGFSPSEIANLGLYLLVSGLVGAILTGIWIDCTNTYKITSLVLIAGNVIFLTGITQTVYHAEYSRTLLLMSTVLMGFCAVSYIPISLGLASELTFPLQPALVNGTMILLGQASAFIQSIVFALTLDVSLTLPDGTAKPADELLAEQQDHAWWTFFGFVMVACICFGITLFVQQDLRRFNFKKETESQESAAAKNTYEAQLDEDGYKRLDENSQP